MNAISWLCPLGQGSDLDKPVAPRIVNSVAATTTGALAGSLNGLIAQRVATLSARIWLVVVLLMLVLGLRELGWLRFRIPQRRWQIPATLVQGSLIRAALVWGGVLGCGGLTYLGFSTLLAVHLLILTLGSAKAGLLVGAVYGFFRSVMCLWSPSFLRSSQTELPSLGLTRLMKYEGLVQRVNGWALVMAAIVMGLSRVLAQRG